MKLKLVIFSALLALSLKGFSQVSQGDIFAGGSFNLSNDAYTHNKNSFRFTLAPNVGYLVTDKIAIGLSLGFDHRSWDDKGAGVTTKHNYNQFSIGPFARYYVSTANDKFLFFVQG